MTIIDFIERRANRVEEAEYQAFMDQVKELLKAGTREQKLTILRAFETKDVILFRSTINEIQEQELVKLRRQWIRDQN